MTDKAALRRQLLAKRGLLDPKLREAADESICRHVEAFIRSSNATSVFIYAAFRGEPDVTRVVGRLPQQVFALPVVGLEPGLMHFYRWAEGEPLRANRMGILEPDPSFATELIPSAHTLVLVPSLAIDRKGYRLGYGGGYYDRFLARHRTAGIAVVGILYEAMLIDALPAESHDMPLSGMISEEGFRSF